MKHIIAFAVAILFFTTGYAQKKEKLDRSKRPLSGPAPLIKLGDIQTFELTNGLKVFLVENHKLPTVAYSIVLDIHPALESDAIGTAAITSQLLTSGTKSRSKDSLDSSIDFIGATLNATPMSFNASSLKKQQTNLLDLLSDVILNSDFKQEELDKLKTQTISSLESEKDDPDAISKNVKSVLNFGKGHPYGETPTKESIDKITLEKCRNYYQTYFRPNVAYLAVVGDVTLEEVKPLMEKYFGAWQKTEVPIATFEMPQASSATRVVVVNKPGAVQSVINITYPIDLKPNSEDVIKAKVLNTILGAGFSSRLFMNLREKHGYTYGSYSSLNNDELVGEFSAYAKVRNAVTDSSITEMLSELNRLRAEKVSSEELEGIKSFLTGSFAIALEDPETVARFAINIERYHLPKDYYTNYLTTLSAVTADDVFAMAQKYIRPQNATILVVGDKEEITKNLTQFSKAPVEFYDNYGNTIISVTKTIPKGVSAKTVIEDYIKAIGGAKAVKKIKDLRIKMNTQLQGMDVNVVTQQKAPNKFSMSFNMGAMTVQKDVFDGTTGKQTGMQGNAEITGEALDELKTQATMNIEMQYQKLGYTLNLKGIEEINYKDAYVVEVTSPKGKKSTEWYEVESGLKIRSSQTSQTPQGPMVQTVDYLEYKEVDGVKFPSVITMGGAMSMKLTAETIEVNKGIEDAEFSVE
ncbi:MAG: insulinase family protein [Bacteroidetes bacterium]|nr:insulinase family protein [Bacteroidota bacterium]